MACLEEEAATYGAAEPATQTFSMCIEQEAVTDAAAEAATKKLFKNVSRKRGCHIWCS